MVFFYILFPLMILLQKILYRCRHSCNCAMNMARKLRRMLYYSWIVTTVFESYSLISICCLIAYPVISFETWGLAVQALVCILFSVFFLTAPFILMRSLSKRIAVLDNRAMMKRFGSVYEDLDLKRGRWIFLQPAFFLIRRLILAFTVVMVPYLIAQIYLVIAQSLISLLIVDYVHPFKDRSQRKMEIFNEVILVLVLYTMMCFTPWVQEVESKVRIGYLSCFFVATHFVVNLAIMLRGSLLGLSQRCKLRLAKKAETKTRAHKKKIR